MGTSMANLSEVLKKARDLTGEFPSSEGIKLHKRQCERLRCKLRETLDHVENEERSCRYPALYRKVFHELHKVARRLKHFVVDCCYESEGDFILAAIKVSAHKERFLNFHVQLDWCVFLVECIKHNYAHGRTSVPFQTLQQFEWAKEVDSLLEGTRGIVEEDFSDFKELLRQHVNKPGEHQIICATLLRRFKDTYHHHQVPDHVVKLEVPDVESVERQHAERIGGGGYGDVFNFNWNGKDFAVKVPKFDTLDKEVEILEKCCHPNIVNLILFHRKPSGSKQSGKQFLMMERLSMDLQTYISERKESPRTHLDSVDMILQVCEGMRYLSDEQFVSHRDLKPKNILIKKDPQEPDLVVEVQVADFGVAKWRAALDMSSRNTPNIGTTKYRAPEMSVAPGQQEMIHEKSQKSDMFSFAVTCCYILTGMEPYDNLNLQEPAMEEAIQLPCCCVPKQKNERKQKMTVQEFVKKGGRPSLPEDCPDELSLLLQQCWHPEPSKRPASFSEICVKLRLLKAKLLVTCDEQGETSTQEVSAISAGFLSGDVRIDQLNLIQVYRPLRILVLGNTAAVIAAFSDIFGAPQCMIFNGNIIIWESASPPLWLYHDTSSKHDFTKFVKKRNRRWHQEKVKAAWKNFLYDPPRELTTSLFPDSNERLHAVWFICMSIKNLPDDFLWKELTTELYGLPVQILVTDRDENRRGNIQCYGNLRFQVDRLIQVDLADAHVKFKLWRTCWEVKTRAEIENAAMIISAMREKLGPTGIRIPVGVAAKTTKAFSVKQSKKFAIDFLSTYWNVPKTFVDVLKKRIEVQQNRNIRTQQAAAPNQIGTIQPGEFVFFCLQNAASILCSEREHYHDLVRASSEFMESREAQARSFESYFENLDPSNCNIKKVRDIQTFLQAVFEGRALPFGLE